MAKDKLGVNPWTHIWIKPRETVRAIVDFNPKHRFWILSFLYGLPMLLHMAQNLSLGGGFTTVGIVIVALVLAVFAGWLGLTIASGLIYWTGKWIGGQASYFPVRAAVSWSNVPNIIAVIVWLVLIFNFRDQIFLAEFDEMNFAGSQMTLLTGALIVQTAIAIWSFILLVKGIGEVQGFSAWKGVLNVLIPFFLAGIFIWVISWFFWVGNGMTGV